MDFLREIERKLDLPTAAKGDIARHDLVLGPVAIVLLLGRVILVPMVFEGYRPGGRLRYAR